MKVTHMKKYFIILCGLLKNSVSWYLVSNNHKVNLMDILIPTVHSENELCKNHSLMYLENLSNFTVWATDMFDASTKFPNGMFFGSSYNTGNFDECVKVHLPGKEGFSGQHCMAHFRIEPLHPVVVDSFHDSKYEDYKYIYNVSTWKKIAMYGQNRMKKFRDETYITFCIPSTCSYKNLESALKQKVEVLKKLFSMDVEVSVDQRHCQVERKPQFSQKDFIFMSIVAGFIILEIFCTAYHLLTNSGMNYLKLSGMKHDVIKAFSYSNAFKKITSTSSNDDGTFCMHGIKVIATLWVIFGHRVMFTIGAPQLNPFFFEDFYGKIEYSPIHNAPIIVDTFFTISGFLACYLILLEIDRQKRLNIFAIYLHRIIRLTPVYALFLGFYCTVFYLLGNGPFWDTKVLVEKNRCSETWWTNLLYINNYVAVDKSCMFHSWYISADTQFFLLVPILAYMLWRYERIGLILGTIFITVLIILQAVIVYVRQEDPFLVTYMNSKILQDPVIDKSFQISHVPSHMRASPYFVGAIAGFVKYKLRTTDYKIFRSVRYLFWILCAVTMLAILFTAYLFFIPQEDKNFVVSGIYSSLHRFLWAVCTAWCFIGVSEGYGQLIAPILNWAPWRILSRITYTSYLTHGALHLYTFGSMRYPVHVGKFSLLKSTISDIFIIYAIGFCLSLAFESPILELENIILKRKPQVLEKKEQGQEREIKSPMNSECVGTYTSKIFTQECSLKNGKLQQFM